MEFRRVEIHRIHRHTEFISKAEACHEVFDALYSHRLKFAMHVRGYAPMNECTIVSVHENTVDVLVRSPNKCRMNGLSFEDVDLIEIICNHEIVSEEDDDGGRWARII